MAKAVNNMYLRGVRGKLGQIVVRHMRDGSIRVSAVPDFSNRVFSIAQQDHQARFKEAAAYACRAIRMEPAYEELSRRTRQKAYNIALSDWFSPPVIQSIERVGNAIRVEASDNVMVVKVWVKILDETGEILEQGGAMQRDPELCPEWWEYFSHSEGKTMRVEAWDLAGNRTASDFS